MNAGSARSEAESILFDCLPFQADLKRILAAQGLPAKAQARLSEGARARYSQVLETVRDRASLRAVASLVSIKVERTYLRCGEVVLRPAQSLLEKMVGVNRACFLVCTAGPEVDEYILSLSERGELAKAWVAETAASYAVSDACSMAIESLARRFGWGSAPESLAPGDEGWSLQEQEAVLALAGGKSIGVEVTAGGVMRPGKTVTAMVFPSSDRSCGPRCLACTSRPSCSFRFGEGRPTG